MVILEQNDSLAKLCTTRWTVKANDFNQVINNFGPLFELWDICLDEKLDKETRSHILGYKSQMMEFRFFFGINLAYRMYLITDNLSRALQRETISSIGGRETVKQKAVKQTVKQKAAKPNFINEFILPRKRTPSNYKPLNDFFIVQGQSSEAQPYFPSSSK